MPDSGGPPGGDDESDDRRDRRPPDREAGRDGSGDDCDSGADPDPHSGPDPDPRSDPDSAPDGVSGPDPDDGPDSDPDDGPDPHPEPDPRTDDRPHGDPRTGDRSDEDPRTDDRPHGDPRTGDRSDEDPRTGDRDGGEESAPGHADRPRRGDRRPSRSDPPRPAEGADAGASDSSSTYGFVTLLREIGSTIGAVVLVGLVLFAVSGVWPPLVAVESGSMEPHMYKGDLVFIVEEGRFAPQDAVDGVVTHRAGEETGYWSFGNYGNVVVYRPHTEVGSGEFRSDGGPPVIHRAQFYVEENEDWVAMANESYLGNVDSCRQVSSCPAPHDGFITKGDHNARYDQATGLSTVVKREWVRGTAKFRIPWLGCVRLQLSGDGCF